MEKKIINYKGKDFDYETLPKELKDITEEMRNVSTSREEQEKSVERLRGVESYLKDKLSKMLETLCNEEKKENA